jgi:hypothetical protein
MLQHYDEESSIPLLHPKCNSITSTKFPLTPARKHGWAPVNRNDKRSFEATEVGSEIVSPSVLCAQIFTELDLAADLQR